jgi:hypothetical protein
MNQKSKMIQKLLILIPICNDANTIKLIVQDATNMQCNPDEYNLLLKPVFKDNVDVVLVHFL